MVTETINACVSEQIYMELIKKSKELGVAKSTYARELLEYSLLKYNRKKAIVIKNMVKTSWRKNGYITIKVRKETSLKIKELASKNGYTVPTLCGNFIEMAYQERKNL